MRNQNGIGVGDVHIACTFVVKGLLGVLREE